MEKEKYYALLGRSFNSTDQVVSEIINLKAILNLPKGTEHFVSDLHGEYDAFQHLLRNASGNIKGKIKDLFYLELSTQEQKELATLVYYPELRLERLKHHLSAEWYKKTIDQLIQLTRLSASKYTRSKVRKSLPERFRYILEELLYQNYSTKDKEDYYNQIITDVIQLKQAKALIIDLSYTIQRLAIDHLHIVGDIYDRGPAPDKIMEALIDRHSVDIQWGNHDIIWMGAASGSKICMMNVIRICARYFNLSIIEDAYGINLRPLLTYAEKYYTDNPAFRPKLMDNVKVAQEVLDETTKIHQAAAILQFKLEEQLVARRPEFNMSHRELLSKTNYKTHEITINEEIHPLTNTCFTTVNPENPAEITAEENQILDHLLHGFIHSEKLRRHLNFLFKKGSMYLVYNENLLIHGCVPLLADGSFKALNLDGQAYSGKKLMDFFENALRQAYKEPCLTEDFNTDLIWYLWSGECSSLFGKKEMTTFERYFIEDKTTHKEIKNPYYALREDEQVIKKILAEFDLCGEDSHIINGHTPIKEIKGEIPIKAGGKMIVIDGGFSKPYQKTTGLAGYTLLYNSYGMQLVAHKAFSSIENILNLHEDVLSIRRVVDRPLERKKVSDTTIGQQLKIEIADLTELLNYYTYH